MRHRISGRKLGRTSSHRKSLLANMAVSLIIHEQINTTLAKAKELRPYVEKLVTLAKRGDLHSRRQAFSKLHNNNEAVKKLFDIIGQRYNERNGGYTRVLRSGYRFGDSAPTAVIELVDRDINAKGVKDRQRIANQREDDESAA